MSSIIIPNNVTYIGGYAFSGCRGLTTITIPNNVEIIGEYAFQNCPGLTSLTIGDKVSSINRMAFASCNGLKNIYCFAETVPTTATNAFGGTEVGEIILHVPDISVGAYKIIEPWSYFGNIVKIGAKFKITYKVDGIEYKTYEIECGETITPEIEPTKEGYTFSGWSERLTMMPAHDVTITGSFTINKYKLTYKVDNEEYKTSEIEYGTDITAETEPTKEGYTFSGWSEIPETMPAHDVVITGTFAINKYNITYKIDGEIFKTEIIEYGSTIITPEAPEREGYTFEWIDVPETMPAYDIIILGSYTSGINAINADAENVKCYTLEGKCLEAPHKGVNIVRKSDGKTKKVVVK